MCRNVIYVSCLVYLWNDIRHDFRKLTEQSNGHRTNDKDSRKLNEKVEKRLITPIIE